MPEAGSPYPGKTVVVHCGHCGHLHAFSSDELKPDGSYDAICPETNKSVGGAAVGSKPLEVGELIHMFKVLSVDADVSEMLGLPQGTITAVEAIKQCEGQAQQNIVSANEESAGVMFIPAKRPQES